MDENLSSDRDYEVWTALDLRMVALLFPVPFLIAGGSAALLHVIHLLLR
jgi:hypothetical protein